MVPPLYLASLKSVGLITVHPTKGKRISKWPMDETGATCYLADAAGVKPTYVTLTCIVFTV